MIGKKGRMKKVIIYILGVLLLTFGSLLRESWVEMSVIDPGWSLVRSGAVRGWGWPLEFMADNPHPVENRTLGPEDIFLFRPFLFDLLTFSLLLGAIVLTPVFYMRLTRGSSPDDRTG